LRMYLSVRHPRTLCREHADRHHLWPLWVAPITGSRTGANLPDPPHFTAAGHNKLRGPPTGSPVPEASYFNVLRVATSAAVLVSRVSSSVTV
jgi:hypothetical protein